MRFKKSPDAVGQGGCLDIHTNSGQLALKECGLLDKFKFLARYDGQGFKVVDRNGDVAFDMPYDGQGGRPEVDRYDLRRFDNVTILKLDPPYYLDIFHNQDSLLLS